MKIFTFLTLILASSISFAADETDCCFDKEQTVIREPYIREVR